MLAVLKRVEEYLLKEEQLLLDPEYLYLEPDHFTVELCLVPGHREEAPPGALKTAGVSSGTCGSSGSGGCCISL